MNFPVRALCAAGLLIVSSSHGVLAQQKPVVVTPLMTTSETSSGQPITLPQKEVQVTVSTYDIQPGAVLPWHEHPYARYAYVLAGTLSVTNAVTGQTAIFKTGDFLLEAVGQWHRGASVGSDAVRLLVIDQTEKNSPNVILKD